ncbi:hypothetical protein [Cronobacter phage vB_CtuP_B1]|nr:hypothetical protein [Cronobacter phage vB_CtuP_B1]
MGKSISKAFKKVTNSALGTLGLGEDPKPQAAQEASVAAAPVEVPTDTVEDVDTETTASDEKRVKRSGKRGLQVSRSSGGGISI